MLTWERMRVPSGDWYWYTGLPNGVTVWVHDHSERKGGQPIYEICASIGSKTVHSTERFTGAATSFHDAKIAAIRFGLSEKGYLDKKVVITATLPDAGGEK